MRRLRYAGRLAIDTATCLLIGVACVSFNAACRMIEWLKRESADGPRGTTG